MPVGGLFYIRDTMAFLSNLKTFAYVDGFNLYHRALQNTAYRWVDPRKLLENAVGSTAPFSKTNFYTARVSAKIDPDAPMKQQLYLKAIADLSDLSIIYGSFRTEKRWRVLASDINVLRPAPSVVKVVNPEEKGSDVNLGAHLVRDGFQGKYEQAVVCTNDTDLAEPIRIIVQELGLPVILVTPVNMPPNQNQPTAKTLIDVVGGLGNIYHLHSAHAKAALLSNPYITKGGKHVFMPPGWAAGRQPKT